MDDLVCNLYSTQRPPSGCRSSGTDRHLLLPYVLPLQPLSFRNTRFCRFLSSDPFFTIEALEGKPMLYWSLVFLVIAIIAGVLGFAGVAVAAAGIAKLLFVIFLILFLISLIMHLARGRTV